MNPDPKPAGSFSVCNQALLRAVPSGALRVLEVGCGEGNLGAALKALDPRRQVYGLEREPAAHAAGHLDRVFVQDIERSDPPLEPGSLDCLLYGDELEHLHDPLAVLRRHRPLLAPGGSILCSLPNLQHHSLLRAFLTGDWQYTRAGLLDATHLRFFTASTILKLLLDAGYAPTILEVIRVPGPPELVRALQPLLAYLRLHPGRMEHYLDVYQYVVQGTLYPAEAADSSPESDEVPLSFITCVSDEATLQANLLSSPCLGPGSPHEVLLARNCPSAAAGLNQGLARARNSLVVCVHQDVYLPRGWPQRFLTQYQQAEKKFGRLGVLGVYGVAGNPSGPVRTGHVVDRDRLLRERPALPARVDTLDELLLAVPRDAGLTFEPRLGFHFYGADLCLAARRRALAVVAVDALCLHNSRSVVVPPEFYPSAAALAAKWTRELPISTSCALIDRQGLVRLW